MPSDNRNAWRLPIIIAGSFIIFLILLIICIVLGYTSIDYDEVNIIFIFIGLGIEKVYIPLHPYTNFGKRIMRANRSFAGKWRSIFSSSIYPSIPEIYVAL